MYKCSICNQLFFNQTIYVIFILCFSVYTDLKDAIGQSVSIAYLLIQHFYFIVFVLLIHIWLRCILHTVVYVRFSSTFCTSFVL